MNIRNLTIVCLSLCLVPFAGGQEKKLTRSQLPVAVTAAIDRETSGSTIKGYATEKEHGKTVYEVETMVSGHSRDLQFSADGTLNEIEEEVSMDALPAEVRKGLEAEAKGAKVGKVESLTKKGTLVAYESEVNKNGKSSEIQVGPTGKKLMHEE